MKKKENIEVRIIEDKNLWEDFNLSLNYSSFFQSWNWGEVQKKSGIDVYRFGIFDKDKLLGIFQVFDIKARRGHFLHIRQGPVLFTWDKNLVEIFVQFISDLAKEKRAFYIRVSPLLDIENNSISILKEIGFRESPIHNVDAENRWILKLDNDLEKIFANMRKTTRYLIRKGEKENIKIVRSQNLDDLNKFLNIYYDTAKSKNFVPHSLVLEEFEEFNKENKATIYLAIKEGEILAGAVIIYYGKEAIYRHGATSSEGRNTPASYLLQWEAIKDAKERDMKIYNFFGIAKDNNPKNPWFGLSQFKKGFGGEQLDFVHSMDLPLKKNYWISYLIDYYTKVKKGYNT